MTVLLGNAGAPRWYNRALDRLPAYVEHVRGESASAAEIVLHHGVADETTARVHVLAKELPAVVDAYRSGGLHLCLHAPLTPEFRIAHWADDPPGVRERFLPLLAMASGIAAGQPEPTVLVFHAPAGTADDKAIAAAFLDWAAAASQGLSFAIELRQPAGPDDDGFDRGRSALLRFVDKLDRDDAGICWDVANDWLSREAQPGWTLQPGAEFLARVTHVHLHGVAEDGTVHHPLQAGVAPWREMLASLLERDYRGAVSLEIQYRHALALGEPWTALAGSYALARRAIEQAVLTGPPEGVTPPDQEMMWDAGSRALDAV